MTTPVDGTTGTTGIDPSLTLASLQKTKAVADKDLDKNAFMKLLVAQMKYQNPTSPADGKEYLAQMAQFAMVEKLEAISAAQADLMAWQKTLTAQGLVGSTVTGSGATGDKVTGQVVGISRTASGPVLDLADGGQIAVDKVDKVAAPQVTGRDVTRTGASSTAPDAPTH